MKAWFIRTQKDRLPLLNVLFFFYRKKHLMKFLSKFITLLFNLFFGQSTQSWKVLGKDMFFQDLLSFFDTPDITS